MNPTFGNDLSSIITWWAVVFVVGAAAYPLARRLFGHWWDQGYLLTKAVGLAFTTLFVWQLASYKILPFDRISIIVSLGILFIGGLFIQKISPLHTRLSWKKIVVLELLFFFCFLSWSYIKGHEADIRSLEKFMDYGFSKSIQYSRYFPPQDMWYAGGTINYYYFGHLVQALVSTLSGIHLSYGYNLMLATLFALCFSMSLGIGVQLFLLGNRLTHTVTRITIKQRIFALLTGLLAALLVTLAGNMQTLYAFTKGYTGENPPPFWTLLWTPQEFITQGIEGINRYWYANATRFIPFSIHEFPSYSFVVSDNHGHVLNIPFALLAIASLLSLFVITRPRFIHTTVRLNQYKSVGMTLTPYVLYGGLTAVLLMTNALDGPIYFGLFAVVLFMQKHSARLFSQEWLADKGIKLGAALLSFVIVALPFILNFNSFASGLGINCPPAFMANSKIGPFIFEEVEKCQRSPFWMMFLLWGFFWFCGVTLFITQLQRINKFSWKQLRGWWGGIAPFHQYLLMVFFVSVGLILFAEVFYFKDIYPAHFRSNTMFKLGYQAFMMCSLLSAYVIMMMAQLKTKRLFAKIGRMLFLLLVIPQLFLVLIFPFFSIRSYFGNLSVYRGLDGLIWLKREYPDDYNVLTWLEQQYHLTDSNPNWFSQLSRTDKHVKAHYFTSHIARIPVILEADGDSYTDYNRMSVFTGFPTVIGWGVHEWLWRGSYDVVAPRKEHVRELYETADIYRMKELIDMYNIHYINVGKLERTKFVNLNESRFSTIAKEVFRSGDSVVYAIDK